MDAGIRARILEASAAYESGDFSRALTLYESLAAEGYPHGLLIAARMYIDGLGVNVDMSKADELLAKAEALGVPGANAQRAAWALANGDERRFFVEIRKEAQRGNLSAKVQVAEAYLHGVGIERDRVLGLKLLKEVSDRGSFGAKILLAKDALGRPWLLHRFLWGFVMLVYAAGMSIYLALAKPGDERL